MYLIFTEKSFGVLRLLAPGREASGCSRLLGPHHSLHHLQPALIFCLAGEQMVRMMTQEMLPGGESQEPQVMFFLLLRLIWLSPPQGGLEGG